MAVFDRILADGVRRSVGIVGVDSGTMAVATGRFPDEDFWSDRIPLLTGSYVVTSAGFGDGGYDLVEVADAAGQVTGLEVLFVSPSIEAAGQKAAEDELGPHPDEELMRAFYDRTCTDQQRRAVTEQLDAEREITQRVWEQMLPTVHPADEAAPQVLGELVATERPVGVGDPCYGGPSSQVRLPPGKYVVVTWHHQFEFWGRRVTRVGLYATS